MRGRCLAAGLLVALTAGCAGLGAREPGLVIDTAAQGQPLPGAACTAMIGDLHWEVVTPAVIATDGARGELHVVCNHPGYRTSELIFRPPSVGIVHYPARMTLDMNPP